MSSTARRRTGLRAVGRIAPAVAALSLPVAVARAQPVVPAAPTASTGSVQDTSRDLHNLGTLLTAPDATAAARDQAALRLVARRSPEATRILTDAFQSSGGPAAQIAIARALAQATVPDPVFIPLLEGALGNNARLTDAAATALVNYRENNAIFQELQRRVGDRSLADPSRVAIVRAMGGIIQKPVASFLIVTLFNPNESVDVQNAAADALGNMTGLATDNGRDRQRWNFWWQQNALKSDEQFRADVLGNQLRQFAQTRLRYTQLDNSLQTIVGADYAQLQNPADRVSALKRYLSPDGPTPELRVAGAILVADDFASGRPVPEEVRKALRVLIGDADAAVRRAVIGTLGAINDRLAAPALITQLVQETDPQIKKQIALALGNIGDPAAVPALLSVLNDPLFDVDGAAATALASLGPGLRQNDPRLAGQVADTLARVLAGARSHDPSAVGFRAACTAALASLADLRTSSVLRSLTRPAEDDQVREAALQGLGNLNDPNELEVISEALDDPDAAVRLAAAKAMQNVAGFPQAEQLYKLLDPANENDGRVRDQAWLDLQHILSAGTKEQLVSWPDRFKNDPEKRLFAQQALAAAIDAELKQQPQPAPGLQAGDEQSLAEEQQNIGETLMDLHRPDDAAAQYGLALKYWSTQGRSQPGSESTLDGLVGDMEGALLRAGNYDGATAFAANQLKINPAYQRIVGPAIKNEASRLKDTGDAANAAKLVAAALKMSPPLEERYRDELQETSGG